MASRDPYPQFDPRQALGVVPPLMLPAAIPGALPNDPNIQEEPEQPAWLKAIPFAALGLGVGASIRERSAAPLVSGVTGFLGGRQQREGREADQAQQEIANEMARRRLDPTLDVGPGGATVRGVRLSGLEGGPGIDAPTAPGLSDVTGEGAAHRDAVAQLALIESLMTPFQPEPRFRLSGREFPDTPEGQAAAQAWDAQVYEGRIPGQVAQAEALAGVRRSPEQLDFDVRRAQALEAARGDGSRSVADLRAEASGRIREEFGHIPPRAGGYPAALWDSMRRWLGEEYPELSSSEKNNLITEFLGAKADAVVDPYGNLYDEDEAP